MATEKQREHFEKVHNRYQDHYYDSYSNFYRSNVIINKIKPFFCDIGSYLEIGCGGGSNYQSFVREGLIKGNYYALDISQKSVDNFNYLVKGNANSKAYTCDFTKKDLDLGESFDLIIFMGVLHHMTNNLDDVMKNVENHLNLGGSVIFFEPNANFLNSIRRIWYKLSDDFDDTNERALTANEIDFYAKNNDLKLFKSTYFGNIGFFIILQSMILHTPKWFKRLTYIPLTFFDLWIENFQSKYTLAAMIRVYKKF